MKFEIKGLDEIQEALSKKVWDKAFKATCNNIASSAFTEAKREIKKNWEINIAKVGTNHYAFKSKQTKEIKKTSGHLFIKPAKLSSNSDNVIEITSSSKNGIPLILFPNTFVVERYKSGKVQNITKRTKIKPLDKVIIKAKIKKNKTVVLKENAFYATMENGHKGIFIRPADKKFPILEKRVVSVRTMFNQIGFEKMLMKKWNEKAKDRMKFWLNRKLGNKY
jgi:hypothetical protein